MNEVDLSALSDPVPPVPGELQRSGVEARARELRARTRRQRRLAAALLLATLTATLIGIGGATRGQKHGSVSISPSTTTPGATAPTRYQVDATVLQDAGHGPQFCLQVFQSLPPQCHGTPVAGWDWTTVKVKESSGRTTWGMYHLVGTYDGKTFTLTQPPTAPHPPKPQTPPPFKTACPTPSGGWKDTNPSLVTLSRFVALGPAAQAPADYAGMWVDSSTPVNGHLNLAPEQVLTVAYTTNIELHRTQLRAIWGGPLCVIQRPHSRTELNGIVQTLVGAAGHKLGLQILEGAVDDYRDDIQLQVILATDTMQQALDATYGPGLVHLTAVLTPLP